MFKKIIKVVATLEHNVFCYFDNNVIKKYDCREITTVGAFKALDDIDFFKETCMVLNDTLAWSLDLSRDPGTCLDLDPDMIYEAGKNVTEEEVKELIEYYNKFEKNIEEHLKYTAKELEEEFKKTPEEAKKLMEESKMKNILKKHTIGLHDPPLYWAVGILEDNKDFDALENYYKELNSESAAADLILEGLKEAIKK